MPSEARSPRLAVLIDADNTSAKIADGLFEEVAKIGEASVRRIYGDFSGTRSKGWADILAKHAIIPQQQFAYTTGKNASDITLVIDAMQKTPESFRQACRRFFYTENLLPGKAKDEESAVSTNMPLQPPSAAVSLIKKVLSQEDAEDGWVSLGTVGKQVLNLAPDFDPRTFGFKKLSDLVRKTNQFEVEQGDGGPIRIRMKRAARK
ncbi:MULTISPECIES: NYN domain-containing protein [Rhizobium]|uniref:NYN domain-containing protein n=1 Tax=Rhizobium TaxID=379 RepID=UPI00143FB4E8|nr:NYN domain-containing protein [Rhizobium leguminosarum]NKL24749.1 NYN domain-containing protein [Rhizobium leguminosarum bv. viciae]NKL59944.1 NYN domain-containing protein [Rhizobium leguminosarum bv. viciae]